MPSTQKFQLKLGHYLNLFKKSLKIFTHLSTWRHQVQSNSHKTKLLSLYKTLTFFATQHHQVFTNFDLKIYFRSLFDTYFSPF